MNEPDMSLLGIRSGSHETKSFWTCSVKTVRANKTKPNDFLSVSPSRLFLQRPFFAVFGKKRGDCGRGFVGCRGRDGEHRQVAPGAPAFRNAADVHFESIGKDETKISKEE